MGGRAVDGHNPSTVSVCLRQLSGSDLPGGKHDDTVDPCPCRVRRRRRRGVSRRRAGDCSRTVFDGFRHSERHPAILERPRRVRALELEIYVPRHKIRDRRCMDERGSALEEGDDWCRLGHRKALSMLLDHASPPHRNLR
jgi:hypothetical protein